MKLNVSLNREEGIKSIFPEGRNNSLLQTPGFRSIDVFKSIEACNHNSGSRKNRFSPCAQSSFSFLNHYDVTPSAQSILEAFQGVHANKLEKDRLIKAKMMRIREKVKTFNLQGIILQSELKDNAS
mmetsp:Transcript_38606/g.44236  ORF Transcript_38606/g.44236 Transcript_38606/m.44236 type:complete len:126 (-) Transcript_38606:126-503(-)